MLTIVTFLPLFGGAIALLFPERAKTAARLWALAVSLVTLALAVVLAVEAAKGARRAELVPWVSLPWPANYHLGLDGLSGLLVALTALVFAACVAASWKEERRTGTYLFLLLALETTSLGLFASQDLLLFYVFWEIMLLPAYFLMTMWGGAAARSAAMKYLIYNGLGGLVLLVGIVGLVATGGTFDVSGLAATLGGTAVPTWVFPALAVPFLIKTPVFPFHTWMPATYGESPAPVAAALSAVQSKAGLYGLIALALPLLPEAARAHAPWILALGAISLLYGAFAALGDRGTRGVVAYSSLSHLGLVLVGVFSFEMTGVVGAGLQMVNHGVFAAALFLLLGMLEARTGTRRLDDLSGLAGIHPKLAAFLLVAAMAALGLPGLNGFTGELLILLGVFPGHPWIAASALLAIILAAAYMLRLFQGVMHGPTRTRSSAPQPEGASRPDLGMREVAVLLPFIVLIVVLGWIPGVVSDPIEPTARAAVTIAAPPAGPAAAAVGR